MMNRKEWKRLFPLCLTLLLLCPGSVLYAAGNVVINEFMADNTSTATDDAGDYDDWIELYNNSSSEISLSGYYLTDDSAKLTQWTFPDVSIPAGAYLIIWADNETGEGSLHANFKLSKDGESILLVAPDGTTKVDEVTFGAQTSDISTGRYPNGTGDFTEMPPSFSAANTVIAAGDVDGSTLIDLGDAILALQVSVGITPSATLYTASDVNGDSMIGLPEAIYALRTVATQEDTGDGITEILLKGDSITVDGSGATAVGSIVTITSAGTYSISGTLTDGQVIVNTADAEDVILILNGVNISNSTTAPVYVVSGEKIIISLADNTQNYVTDGIPDAETDEPDAAIFSKSDLDIEGGGSLTVTGNYSDGIASKDGLVITGGTITVTSADDGIRGKDWLIVKDGNITVNAQGDGLKSTNDEDSEKGYVSVETGTFNITAAGDGIQAETNVVISGGTFTLTTGGGSSNFVSGDDSSKGIKGVASISITGGTFTVSSADDAIHSDGSIEIETGTFNITGAGDGIQAETNVVISGGTFTLTTGGGSSNFVSGDDSSKGIKGVASISITGGTFIVSSADDTVHSNGSIAISGGTFALSSGDDGIHADTSLEISGADTDIEVSKSYEGIESELITISDGTIHIVSSDDGVNVAGGVDGSGQPGWPGGTVPAGNYWLYVKGGYIAVNAAGDGIDVNGSIEMTAGTVIVHGPTANDNGALDYDGSFKITGGFLVAAGSSGMAQAPGTSSTQNSLLLTFNSTKTAGTLVHIRNSSGTGILTFAPSKTYQTIAFSSPELVKGTTYNVYYGGSSTGTVTDGLYTGGTYTAGTNYKTFTVSGVVTTVK